jgi:hypothetical protein
MTTTSSHPRRRSAVLVLIAAVALVCAVAVSAAPPDPNTVGYTTLTNVRINGVLGTTAVVQPGASVAVSADWSDYHPGDCPGCIDFVAVGYAGQNFAGCIEEFGSTGASGSGSVTLAPAPTVPGTYRIVAHYEWVFGCGDHWNTSASTGYTTIAEITVPGDDPRSRTGYCSAPGNTAGDSGNPIPAGTFLNLETGQPLTDPHYRGATVARYGNGYGLTCDMLPGLGYVDTGTKVDQTGKHTGTSSDVYPYCTKSSS